MKTARDSNGYSQGSLAIAGMPGTAADGRDRWPWRAAWVSRPAGTTAFNDTTATAGTHYWYQLIASEQYTGASPSSVSAASASDEWSLPDAPTSLTAAASLYNGIALSWDATTGAANYTIERSDDGGVTFNPIGTVDGSTTTFGDMGVLPAASYSYRVEALTATGGQSAASTVATVSTPTGCVSGLTATAASDGEIDLSWSAGSVTSGLQLLQSTDGSTFTAVQTFTSPTTSYGMTGLTQDTHYWFQLVDSATVGWTVNTDTWTLPPAPTSLTAAATSDGGVDLNWTMDGDASATFDVERALAGTGNFVSVGTCTVGWFHDPTQGASTSYDYQIVAVGANQQTSTPSNVASVTTNSTLSVTNDNNSGNASTTHIWYVNGAVSSSGAGTAPDSAFKTISEAANVALPGDTVDIAPGVYRETVKPKYGGTATQPIVYQAWPGMTGTVTVSGLSAVAPGNFSSTGIVPTTLGAGKIYTLALPSSTGSELGPTLNTATDQVFANGQMLTENRFPYTSSSATPTSLGDFSHPILETIPDNSQISTGRMIQTLSGFYYSTCTFTDSSIPVSWIGFNGLIHIAPGLAESKDPLVAMLHYDGMVNSPGQWFGETCKMSIGNLNQGNPQLPVVPEITFYPATNTSWTDGASGIQAHFSPRPGDEYYLLPLSKNSSSRLSAKTLSHSPAAIPAAACRHTKVRNG